MVLSDKQWNGLKRMLGGNESYTNSVSGHSYITLSRLSEVQDSYLLTYNNNSCMTSWIEVEIHRYSEVANYDVSYLHTLWNLWVKDTQRIS
jgi:hypothetical protein